jgi:hypothetical protein
MNYLNIMRGLFVSIRVTTRSIDSTHPNQIEAVRIQRQGTVPYGVTRRLMGPAASAGNTCRKTAIFKLTTATASFLAPNKLFFLRMSLRDRGRDSSVGIVTRYWPDGPGIESRWGGNFPHPSRPPLGPTQPGLSRGLSGRDVAFTRHPHLAPRLKEEYSSPSGTSWLVLG